MATYQIFLRTKAPRKNESIPIYLRVRFGNNKKDFSLGVSVSEPEKYWDPETNQMKKCQKQKFQEINLANVGKDTSIYVVSVIDIRMKDDGSFEQITVPDSGQNFAGKYLRFFPRRVTLAPNEAQVVKIQLIKTNEI